MRLGGVKTRFTPNHFHLSAVAAPKTAIWDAGCNGCSPATCGCYHRHYHSSGHVWRGRFKAFPIQRDERFLTVLRYAERNPLRAKLVGAASRGLAMVELAIPLTGRRVRLALRRRPSRCRRIEIAAIELAANRSGAGNDPAQHRSRHPLRVGAVGKNGCETARAARDHPTSRPPQEARKVECPLFLPVDWVKGKGSAAMLNSVLEAEGRSVQRIAGYASGTEPGDLGMVSNDVLSRLVSRIARQLNGNWQSTVTEIEGRRYIIFTKQ